MTSREPPDAAYEVSVVGTLGPVLRAIMEPAVTSSCGPLTIIYLSGDDDQDLVDILGLLGSRGLEATTITAIR